MYMCCNSNNVNQSAVMERPCPKCNSRMRPYYLNAEEALWMCDDDENCNFPLMGCTQLQEFIFRVPETGLPSSRKQHPQIGCGRGENSHSRSGSSSSSGDIAKVRTLPTGQLAVGQRSKIVREVVQPIAIPIAATTMNKGGAPTTNEGAPIVVTINEGAPTTAMMNKGAKSSQETEEIDVVTIEDENPNDKCLQFDVEVSIAKHQAPFTTATGAQLQLQNRHDVAPPTTSAADVGVPFNTAIGENRTSNLAATGTLFDKVSIRNPKHLMKLIKSQTRATPYPLPQPFGAAYQLAKEKKKQQMRVNADASTGFAGYLDDTQGKQPTISPSHSVADGSSTAASAVNMKIQNRLKAIEALRFGAGSSASPLSIPPRSANPSPQLAFAGSPHSNASSWGSGVVEPATTSFGSDISSSSNVSLVHQDPLDVDSMLFTPVADPLRMPNLLQSADCDDLFAGTNQMLTSAFEPYQPAVWNPANDLTDPLFLDF